MGKIKFYVLENLIRKQFFYLDFETSKFGT